MTPIQTHHARIMIECGCSVQDVAITFRISIGEALYVVAPALKNNKEAAKFAARHYASRKSIAAIPVIHKGRPLVDIVESRRDDTRIAA